MRLRVSLLLKCVVMKKCQLTRGRTREVGSCSCSYGQSWSWNWSWGRHWRYIQQKRQRQQNMCQLPDILSNINNTRRTYFSLKLQWDVTQHLSIWASLLFKDDYAKLSTHTRPQAHRPARENLINLVRRTISGHFALLPRAGRPNKVSEKPFVPNSSWCFSPAALQSQANSVAPGEVKAARPTLRMRNVLIAIKDPSGIFANFSIFYACWKSSMWKRVQHDRCSFKFKFVKSEVGQQHWINVCSSQVLSLVN